MRGKLLKLFKDPPLSSQQASTTRRKKASKTHPYLEKEQNCVIHKCAKTSPWIKRQVVNLMDTKANELPNCCYAHRKS